jgi:PKD repeat protein
MITMKRNRTWARGRPLALSLVALVLVAAAAAGAPALNVRQTLTPVAGIYTAGAEGTPKVAELTLNLQAAGGAGEHLPVDALLVVDCSASSALGEAKALAFELVELFGGADRIGLVSFSTTARLASPLTTDRARLRTAVADLETSGKSALGDALFLARTELLCNGREDAVLVVLLLADGQSNAGREPDVEGKVASEAGIRIVSIGVGTLVNREFLQTLADDSGGAFFPRRGDAMYQRLPQAILVNRVATGIRIEKVLPPELLFVRATPSPTRTTQNADGTTHLVWEVPGLSLGAAWQTRIELQAKAEGAFLTDLGSYVTYMSFRGVTSRVEIPSLELKAFVRHDPIAAFLLEPGEPRVGMEILFDATASRSGEPFGRGKIVSYAWDFDGSGTFDLVTAEPTVTYTFPEAGEQEVVLQVVDDIGKTASVTQTFAVAAGVSASREIDTCLPADQTIAGATVKVKVTITANATIRGLTLHEAYPAGWTLAEVDNAGATFRKGTTDWVFPEVLSDGDVRVISYALTSPSQAAPPTSPEKEPRGETLSGVVASSSPRLSIHVLGEDKLVLRATLPIPIAIGYYDVTAGRLAPCLEGGGIISFAQLQYAISLWVSDQAVPYTGGLKVDSQSLRDLTAYWLTGTWVWNPLPSETTE